MLNLTALLRKEPILNLGGEFLVVVRHSIKPTSFQPNLTPTATSNFE